MSVDVSEHLPITSVDLEFKMKLSDTQSTSKLIARTPSYALQVYTNSGRVYNQGAWLWGGTSNILNCKTHTTGEQRTLTVNANSTTQNFTRNFTNSDTVFHLFSSSNDRFNSISIKINNSVVGEYVFARKIGDSEVVMYDTLSGQVYHNDDTGHFEEVTI